MGVRCRKDGAFPMTGWTRCAECVSDGGTMTGRQLSIGLQIAQVQINSRTGSTSLGYREATDARATRGSWGCVGVCGRAASWRRHIVRLNRR